MERVRWRDLKRRQDSTMVSYEILLLADKSLPKTTIVSEKVSCTASQSRVFPFALKNSPVIPEFLILVVVRGRCVVCLEPLRGCMRNTIRCRTFFQLVCLGLAGVAIARLPASRAPSPGSGLYSPRRPDDTVQCHAFQHRRPVRRPIAGRRGSRTYGRTWFFRSMSLGPFGRSSRSSERNL